jgi:lipopolysaccharide export system permease protein
MKILHRYIFNLLIKNFSIGLATFVFLFLMVDFLDRIDNILAEKASIWLIVQYFACKIPMIVNLMLPVALIFATLFTFGLLSKSSEITAMRASGVTIIWLAKPLLILGLTLSASSLVLNELLVPISERKQKEIYNLKIRQKDTKGGYNQSDFWWRSGSHFYAIDMFNSKSRSMRNLSDFEVNSEWKVIRRTDAESVKWLTEGLGWSMQNVVRYHFDSDDTMRAERLTDLSLPIVETPRDFYEFNDDPSTMSFSELRGFIKKQSANGVSTSQYLPDLHSKLAFPLIIFITGLLVLPFTLIPARSGSMALSSLAAIGVAFMYYAVDSFSIAMGRAELLPAIVAAWTANLIMGGVAVILNAGSEAPR